MRLIIRSSGIHAAGCFTLAPVKRNTKIVEYTGERLHHDDADKLYENLPYTYLFGVSDKDMVIDGFGMAMYVNHSCDPNCETEEDEDGKVWISSMRDIAAGEELTYDYLLYEGDGDAPCSCGSKKCRGSMYSPKVLARRKREAAKKRAARKKKALKAKRK
jgi:SET domain-containing protein